MIKIGNIELPDFPLLLAPMEDVSDPPFRRLCKMHGADMMYSEFISSEGLIRDAIKSRMKLDIFDYERPVGIQIFWRMRKRWLCQNHNCKPRYNRY
jgi:tRNA-dihydrouridine synthase